jgi:hypothetical protein
MHKIHVRIRTRPVCAVRVSLKNTDRKLDILENWVIQKHAFHFEAKISQFHPEIRFYRPFKKNGFFASR